MKKFLLYLTLFLIAFGLVRFTTILPVEAQTENRMVGRYQLFQGQYEVSSIGITDARGIEKEKARVLLRIDTVTGEVDEFYAAIRKNEEGVVMYSGKWIPLEGETPLPIAPPESEEGIIERLKKGKQ